jgi:hypothetical protein
LVDSQIEFIIVGGIAAVIQGVPLTTFDLDIVHKRDSENVRRIIQLLTKLNGRFRGHPVGKDLIPKEDAFLGPGHQLMQTDLGALDFLGVIEQNLGYEDLMDSVVEIELRGRRIKLLALEKIARLKSDSPREKDRLLLEMIKRVLKEAQK